MSTINDATSQSLPKHTIGHQTIVDNYSLYLLSDYFVIEPKTRDKNKFLVIDRKTHNIHIQNTLPDIHGAEQRFIHGIVGIINLLSGPYLIIVTSKLRIGTINGHAVYKIQSTELISYTSNTSNLNENQMKYNAKYLSMFQQVLDTESFYFSYSYDLTHTLQRFQISSTSDFSSKSFIERADPRFVWNRYLLDQFLKSDATSFTLPIIHGFIAFTTLNINGNSLIYGIISRRSVHRAGTRLFVRGIDDTGCVANYVETEQILQLNEVICSYVQTRGSVPCYWVQTPNLHYKPKIKVIPSDKHSNAFRQHFQEQEYYYGKQFLISLTNHHGSEGKLNSKYRELYEQSENGYLKFEDFDFHKECAGMRYDRLTILLARVIADQDDYGYLVINKNGTILQQQSGVFRTNCVDCLDRTNVVQTLFAKRILEKQLQHYNIIKYNESIDSHIQLSDTFKNIWADNADAVSVQYAGTGALKTDYTRTGQRSTMGLLKDGYNSLMRYVLNNFFDGVRQDGINLFLGHYRISAEEGRTHDSCPLGKELSKKLLALPIITFIAISMCFVNMFLPMSSFRDQLGYITFWSITAVSTLFLTMFYGRDLVNMPKLGAKIKQD